MEEKTLPLDWVHQACVAVYGKPLRERAWRTWKRTCEVKRHASVCSQEEAAYLLTLAHIKRYKPRARIDLLQVKMAIAKQGQPIEAIASKIHENFYLDASGRDLPEIIRQVTGRTISMRHLYRLAEKHKLRLRAGEKIPRAEIQQWVDIVSGNRESAA